MSFPREYRFLWEIFDSRDDSQRLRCRYFHENSADRSATVEQRQLHFLFYNPEPQNDFLRTWEKVVETKMIFFFL